MKFSAQTQKENTLKNRLTTSYLRVLAILAILVPLAALLGGFKWG
jgi:hypothetical protein